MWMSAEDARSDFILAAAATVFGQLVVGLLQRLPIYPSRLFSSALLDGLLTIMWVFVLTALVPILLVRYRDQDARGYGLDGERSAWVQGLVVAVPIVVVGYLRGLPVLGPIRAVAGRVGGLLVGNPVILDGTTGPTMTERFLLLGLVVVATLSAAVLYGFLITRAREAFRPREITVIEGLRTFGIGAAGAALVLGLLAVLGGRIGMLAMLLNVGGLAVTVLIADRLVAPTDTTSRWALVAPAIVAAIIHLLAAGGLFRGDLLSGLFLGAMAAGIVFVVAALIETRRYAWAAVPLVIAAGVYPTCMTLPGAFVGLLGPC